MDSDRGDAKREILGYYGGRAKQCAAEESRLIVRDRLVGISRLVAAVTGILLLVAGWLGGGLGWYVAGGISLAVFLSLVVYHEQISDGLERARQLRQIHEACLARMRRDWDAIPPTPVDVPPRVQAVAMDLDLTGRASLFHLICAANTPHGVQTVRDWLLEPASPTEIRARQEAVIELAPHRDFRERLWLEARSLGGGRDASERFVQWAEGEPWLQRRPWLKWTCRILPAIGVAAFGLTAARVIPPEWGGCALIATLLLNFAISVLFGGPVHGVFSQVTRRRGGVRSYLQLFELLYSLPEGAAKLEAIKQELTERGGGVLLRMRELNWIMALANISHSPLLFVVLYLPLQAFFVYDFHILTLLEAWQRKFGRHAQGWFEALGQFEALASLATLAHDNPEWAFPKVDPEAATFAADALGHPLLTDDDRVANDVEVGPSGQFLLVTGSNMSGKSTLLRAIGVNASLAQAGSPVCARRLVMPPSIVATSMRIHDSLAVGVSFYMAELMRLKEISDQAKQHADGSQGRLFYLLDEILQGTNSRERHIAVVRVLKHLCDHHAFGAVSTHDLDLATSPALSGVCESVHFRETLHDQDAEQPMTFDYLLRPGVATTTNALKLLEIVGLAEDTDRPDVTLSDPDTR